MAHRQLKCLPGSRRPVDWGQAGQSAHEFHRSAAIIAAEQHQLFCLERPFSVNGQDFLIRGKFRRDKIPYEAERLQTIPAADPGSPGVEPLVTARRLLDLQILSLLAGNEST